MAIFYAIQLLCLFFFYHDIFYCCSLNTVSNAIRSFWIVISCIFIWPVILWNDEIAIANKWKQIKGNQFTMCTIYARVSRIHIYKIRKKRKQMKNLKWQYYPFSSWWTYFELLLTNHNVLHIRTLPKYIPNISNFVHEISTPNIEFAAIEHETPFTNFIFMPKIFNAIISICVCLWLVEFLDDAISFNAFLKSSILPR